MNLWLLAAWIGHNLITALTLWNKIIRSRWMRRMPFYSRTERVTLPDGNVVITDFVGLSVIVSIYFEKLYETLDGFRPRRGWVVVDGGAHMGIYTVRAALMTGAEGKVIAVEPEPGNFAILEANVKANGLTNVVAIKAALGSEVGVGKLSVSWMSTAHSLTELEPSCSITVQTLTLDDLLRQIGLERVDLVKLDVEGSELQALEGAKKTMRTHRSAKFVVEPESMDSAIKVVNFLRRYRQSVVGVYAVSLPSVKWPPTVYAW